VAVVAALALFAAALPAQAQVAPAGEIRPIAAGEQQAPRQDQPAQTQTTGQPGKKDDNGDGVPIWAGIGLILLAAAAGSLAARARNRRRMREYTGE
jgi:hypothetical protein